MNRRLRPDFGRTQVDLGKILVLELSLDGTDFWL